MIYLIIISSVKVHTLILRLEDWTVFVN